VPAAGLPHCAPYQRAAATAAGSRGKCSSQPSSQVPEIGVFHGIPRTVLRHNFSTVGTMFCKVFAEWVYGSVGYPHLMRLKLPEAGAETPFGTSNCFLRVMKT
jgi:hypothetical protein